MPYKSNYVTKSFGPYKKKKGKYARKGQRRGAIYGAAAGQLWKDVKRLKDMINIEYKYIDTVDTGSNPTYAGGYATFTMPAAGTGDSQRIGDSVKLQRLMMRGEIRYATAGTDGQTVRLIIVNDKQNKISAVSDLLDSNYLSTVNAVNAPKNYDKRFQTKILYDRSFLVNSQNIERRFVINLPLNFHAQFDAAGSTIDSGSLKYFLVSDQMTNPPTVNFVGRITYTDN